MYSHIPSSTLYIIIDSIAFQSFLSFFSPSFLIALPPGSESDPVLALVEYSVDGRKEGISGQPGVAHSQSTGSDKRSDTVLGAALGPDVTLRGE